MRVCSEDVLAIVNRLNDFTHRTPSTAVAATVSSSAKRGCAVRNSAVSRALRRSRRLRQETGQPGVVYRGLSRSYMTASMR